MKHTCTQPVLKLRPLAIHVDLHAKNTVYSRTTTVMDTQTDGFIPCNNYVCGCRTTKTKYSTDSSCVIRLKSYSFGMAKGKTTTK